MFYKSKYSKFFLYITFIISLTIVAISYYHYTYFSKVIIEKEYASRTRELKQSSIDFKMIIQLAQEKAIHIYRDMSTSQLLFYTKLNVYEKMKANAQLVLYESSTPYLHSIYLYNNNRKSYHVRHKGLTEYSSEEFYDDYISHLLNEWNNDYILRPISRLITMPNGEKEPVYSILFAEHTSNSKQQYAVVLNLSVKEIIEHIKSSNISNITDTFLIDEQGCLLSLQLDDYTFLDPLTKEDYINHIAKDTKPMGYIMDSIKDENHVISYYRDPHYNWIYINRTSVSSVLATIQYLRNRTWIITSVCLIIGLCFSYFFSRKFRKSMDGLGQQVLKLQKETKANKTSMDYNKLKEALRLEKTADDVTDLLLAVEPGFAAVSSIMVIYVSMDNIKNLKETYSYKDRSLFQFALKNVGDEILKKKIKWVLALEPWSYEMVFIIDMDKHLSHNEIHSLMWDYQEWIKKSIHVTISCGISSIGRINELHKLLHEAKAMIDYRLITGPGHCHHFKLVNEKWMDSQEKLIAIEEELYSALRKGDRNEAIYIIDHLCGGDCLTPSTLIYTYNKFCFVLFNVIHRLNESLGIHMNFQLKEILNSINSMEYHSQIKTYIYRLVEGYCGIIESYNDNKKLEMMNKVNVIIQNEYAKQDLSIQDMADQLGISCNHMSRLYKKDSQMTILQALVNYRMKIARELLVHSEMSIAQIAENVGFSSSSYFYRVFKKYHQVTPLEYRQNH